MAIVPIHLFSFFSHFKSCNIFFTRTWQRWKATEYAYVVILYIGTEKITERWLIGWHIFCFLVIPPFFSTSARLDKAVTHLLGSFSLHIYILKGNFYFSIPCTRLAILLPPNLQNFFLVLFFCFTCVCLGLMAPGYRLYTYGREYTRVTSC